MTRPRIAVVGVGHLGRHHVRILTGMDRFQLVAAVDPVAANRAQIAGDYGVNVFADHREIIGRVDAAVIAVPTRCHRQVAADLVAHGIHLLVEKPLAPTLAEAEELVALARSHGAQLQVGHVERFNPAWQAAQQHIREPKYIEAVRQSGFTFRSTDIGVVLDLMIHDIDLVLSVVRSPVARVEALGLALFGRHEDVANARLTFDNGCVATLSASRASHRPAREIQVWSRGGFAAIDLAARTASLVKPSGAIIRREIDAERMSPDEVALVKDRFLAEHLPRTQIAPEPADALSAELDDFAESILAGRSPRVSGEQARDAVAVAEWVLEEIEAHSWDGLRGDRVGPQILPSPQIIPGPHWGPRYAPGRGDSARREAG